MRRKSFVFVGPEPVMSSSASAACPALIAGAGPVGLTLAAHLHHHGMACRIIDRSPQPSDKSKALVLWPRTLEMLDDLGIAADFLAAGRLVQGARLYGNGRELVHVREQSTDTAFPRPLMLAQSETERLLLQHLASVGIAVERSVELIDCADQADQVLATLRHADGHEEPVRCDWLLGCDGAHSLCRKKAGLEFSGEAEPNDWALCDCKVEGPVPQDEISIFWHHKGVLALFPFAEDRCRVIADLGMAHDTGHPPDPTLDDVQRLVDERGPAGVRLSVPHWLSGFRIHERKVAQYRRGRVFLAGDAAHIHSPAGGQGMNTGMQDAWNLAWKVALVQSGRARPDPLLDSYSQERGAVGEKVLRDAARLTRVATLRNWLAQFLRNQMLDALGHFAWFRRTFLRNLSELDIHYPKSPLNGESRGGWPARAPKPGDRIAEARLQARDGAREERLLQIIRGPSYHLLLLSDPATPSSTEGLQDVAKQAQTTFPGVLKTHVVVPAATPMPAGTGAASLWLDPQGTVHRWFGSRGTVALVVRPDGYLGCRQRPASWDDLNAYLSRYLIAR